MRRAIRIAVLTVIGVVCVFWFGWVRELRLAGPRRAMKGKEEA